MFSKFGHGRGIDLLKLNLLEMPWLAAGRDTQGGWWVGRGSNQEVVGGAGVPAMAGWGRRLFQQ